MNEINLKGYFEPADEVKGLPVVSPLLSLEDVLHWEKSIYTNMHKASVPYIGKKLPNRNRLLVCHDMKGGYLHDRYVQGVKTFDAYRFFNWDPVDIFVYFSHSFITIPPPCWTNVAHKHNTLVLGTVITEWDKGREICGHFLKTKECCLKLAEKLTMIAIEYGFEGWLINIENEIEKNRIGNLCYFVKSLTELMHERVGNHSQVIWYDSVISSGELKWQNELNLQNKLFFDACDGIFLNYTWKEENLRQSAENAESRMCDVYVGVDVFGRGCPGGGGYNSNLATNLAHSFDLSVAIFGQGWVYETQDANNFEENEQRFWNLLETDCPRRPTRQFPFYTNFCIGNGKKFWRNGQVISTSHWSNLNLQTFVPKVEEGIEIIWDDSFDGSVALKLHSICNENIVKHKLFDMEICLPSSKLHISYSLKFLNDQKKCNFGLNFFVNNNEHKQLLLCGEGDKWETGNVEVVLPTDENELQRVYRSISIGNIINQPSLNGWESRHFIVSGLANGILSAIRCYVETDGDFQILLGHIQIAPVDEVIKTMSTRLFFEPITLKEVYCDSTGKSNTIYCTLRWRLCEDIDYYTVYFKPADKDEEPVSDISAFKLLGHTHCCTFKVCDLLIDEHVKQVLFLVEGTHKSGIRITCKTPQFLQINE